MANEREPNWMLQQFVEVVRECKRWPRWMKVAAGIDAKSLRKAKKARRRNVE